MLPSASMGVTMATRLPANMRYQYPWGFQCSGRAGCYEAPLPRGKPGLALAPGRSQPDAAPGTLRTVSDRKPKTLRHAQMKQHLAVSAIGSDRTGMVHELTRVISESGG